LASAQIGFSEHKQAAIQGKINPTDSVIPLDFTLRFKEIKQKAVIIAFTRHFKIASCLAMMTYPKP